MLDLFDLAVAKAINGNGGGGSGGDITLETLNVSQNGTTNAPSGKAYNKVVASVPNSYAAGDEGKVVSNGALVAQTAHATVTENGTIDTTLNNSVTVDVPSGGGGITETSFTTAADITNTLNIYNLCKLAVPDSDCFACQNMASPPESGLWLYTGHELTVGKIVHGGIYRRTSAGQIGGATWGATNDIPSGTTFKVWGWNL